ncbi:MerC domain-containing protein [Pseudomarimonas salicorniae]|uniref:MerC domain-containing protein n=1 Tax=Pseudomarimonas salicorniae TaxID=2933270 RepID=A0ABT0GN36_9GAMM|nr:MerC domain-containing protein [Lysobacter sp. CAU 1642]
MLEAASSPSVDALAAGDRLGFVAATLCAVHCAMLPLLAGLLPAVGFSAGGWADIDQAFVMFASVLGISTVAVGYRRHRVLKAAWLLVAGLALLWSGSFTPLHDHGLGHALVMTLGGGLLGLAHLYNLRLGHRASR